MLRTFVAIELPQEVTDYLGRLQEQLRSVLGPHSAACKWVRPEGTHLTLQFLGDVPAERVETINSAIARAASHNVPFQLRIAELGMFPNERRPRVLWVGVEGDAPDIEALKRLQRSVTEEMRGIGYAPDKAFSPHLTLARVREGALSEDKAKISTVLGATTAPDSPPLFDVREVSLMLSRLSPGGAIYTRLFAAPLVTTR